MENNSLEEITRKISEMGNLEHPKGILRKALKQMLKKEIREVEPSKKDRVFNDLIPVHTIFSGNILTGVRYSMYIKPFWLFVGKEALEEMRKEIDDELIEEERIATEMSKWNAFKRFLKKFFFLN